MVNQKPNKPDHIFIDQKRHDWEAPAITGAQLKQLAGVDPHTFDVWQDVPGPEDILVGDNDSVDLTRPGVEKFFTGKKTTTEG
ncbi:MAG: multiubiquitin domain-containing protein [Nitrospirales bacterium]|nr:multiubiquitin domain-containing protein [Nitrospirales bacterium]